MDNVKLEDQIISEIEKPKLKSNSGLYFKKADFNEIEIDLDGPISEVQIINSNGQAVFSFSEFSRKIRFSCSLLPVGIYVIKYKLPESEEIVVRKLILD